MKAHRCFELLCLELNLRFPVIAGTTMDWFERLTGFREAGYEETQGKLSVEGGRLRSLVNGQTFGVGEFEVVSLKTLRDRVAAGPGAAGRIKVELISGDIRELHQVPQYAGALFQVASQFNMLEMISPDATPEHGVTCYRHDRTQGPACAIAAGAATIYRNYFVPVGDAIGQTAKRQLNGLSQLGDALAQALAQPVEALWTMRNGYALCSESGLNAISGYLASRTDVETNTLTGNLGVGLHSDVEVTDAEDPSRPTVSQIFCSALPVAYSDVPAEQWKPFASLILKAAYEATLWAAVLNAQRGASNVVLLTRLGGGAFGNSDDWIDTAMRDALRAARDFDLNVKLVSYGQPTPNMVQLANSAW